MAHTLSDYTTKYKLVRVFGQADGGEVAARLGSPVTIDRRGNLIWFDDFEAANAVKWKTLLSTGSTAELNTAYAWMNNASMKLTTHTDSGDFAAIVKYLPIPIDNSVGIEFRYRLGDGKPITQINLTGYTGSYYFSGAVRYNFNTSKLYYLNSLGVYSEITNTDYNGNDGEYWHYLKLALNWSTKKYIRLMYNNTTYDLSDIALYTAASATKNMLAIALTCIADTDAAASIYVDNVILTQNEP